MKANHQAKQKLAEMTQGVSGWREKAEYRVENHVWLRRSAAMAVKILDALEAKGMAKAEFADKMKVSRQRVNEIVKGRENLTLKTIAEIEAALGITLIADEKPEKSLSAYAYIDTPLENYMVFEPSFFYKRLEL
jgi:transcriptional regulator with XRE-family HTH domain